MKYIDALNRRDMVDVASIKETSLKHYFIIFVGSMTFKIDRDFCDV